MKELVSSLNDFQVLCMTPGFSFIELARTRKALIAAMRKAMGEAVRECQSTDPGRGMIEARLQTYLVKFDKALTPE